MQEDDSTNNENAQSVEIFSSSEFGQVRIYVEHDGTTMICAADTCSGLGIEKTATRRLDNDEKGLRLTQTLGGEQEMLFVTEAGFYKLVLGSRKPEAKAFQRWVTHEVLPSIRNHGIYATTETAERLMNDPDFMIATFTALKGERERRIQLEVQTEIQEKTISKQTAKIDHMRPKALFADAVATSDSTILIGDLAKIIKQSCGVDTGQKRLFEWMRTNGWLIKDGSSKNMPTQKAMDMELFRIKETTISNPDGSVRVTKTTKVTGRGQQYFVNVFAKTGQIAMAV